MSEARQEQAVLTVLPVTRDRWRPTRAGLVSLWRYWDETFTFHGGRLLLRGPNGSGKSMALELLLPFLLDADASPARLTSAAKSRGGLFDRVMTGTDEATRTGFAWVEFSRGGETFTVGARIRASHSTHNVDLNFFTTTLAVGRDLHLLDATRTPLSAKALVQAIGDSGRVHPSGEEHRNAVREVLFPGFPADRYASVISALLALRKEKLSQHLDLAKLSETLSESLPPLDDHDIAAVAEGFERLDRRRAELDGWRPRSPRSAHWPPGNGTTPEPSSSAWPARPGPPRPVGTTSPGPSARPKPRWSRWRPSRWPPPMSAGRARTGSTRSASSATP